MGIIAYKKKTSSGVVKTFYLAVAEGINRFTGKRVQKKCRSIPSEPKAQRIYRELWSACREARPDGAEFKTWGELYAQYLEQLRGKVRSAENLHGFSPHVLKCKKSNLGHVESWSNTHLDLVTPQFVTDQLDLMELNGKSRSMTNHILKEIKCVFAYALHTGAIKSNPFAGMKMRRVPKRRKEALTHEEVAPLRMELRIGLYFAHH